MNDIILAIMAFIIAVLSSLVVVDIFKSRKMLLIEYQWFLLKLRLRLRKEPRGYIIIKSSRDYNKFKNTPFFRGRKAWK